MSLIAILLVTISAFMHAGWNLLSKSKHPSAPFFLVASLTGVLFFSPALLLNRSLLAGGIPPQVWKLLVAAGFFQALYYIALAGAYRAGDMSVAYPLARSSPILVVLVVTLILGRRDQVSPQCIAGIVLVVGGCFLIPLQTFRDLRLRHFWNATCGFALLAAVGTSGYSIVDDEALRHLRTIARGATGTPRVTLLYTGLEAMVASLWLALFIALRPRGRADFRQVIRENKRHAALAGAIIYLTYAIVLVSLAFVKNVSYVVCFRQLSIPVGAAFGILILKEAPHRPKLAGVAVMFAGLVLVATG